MFEINNVTEYIYSNLYVIVPVLYIFGLVLKNTLIVKDKYIPLVLLGLSIVLNVLGLLRVEDLSNINMIELAFNVLTQSILCTGAAVYFNNLVKQSKKEE